MRLRDPIHKTRIPAALKMIRGQLHPPVNTVTLVTEYPAR